MPELFLLRSFKLYHVVKLSTHSLFRVVTKFTMQKIRPWWHMFIGRDSFQQTKNENYLKIIMFGSGIQTIVIYDGSRPCTKHSSFTYKTWLFCIHAPHPENTPKEALQLIPKLRFQDLNICSFVTWNYLVSDLKLGSFFRYGLQFS